MKAIIVSRFGDESVLQYTDAPTPEPGESEVRVRVHAAGVNPVETYIRAGAYGTLPALPYTPGNDGAGVVDAVGPGVNGMAEGDRVFIAAALARRNTGTYAEYVVCDADAVQPLPDAVSFQQGAGLGTPGLAAADALFTRAQAQPGETVLVHGATGGVGTLAVQLARRAGMIVYGTAGSPDGEKLVAELGAHKTFNRTDDGYLEKIRDAAGCGVDVVIEMLANVNLAKDLSLLRTHGRVVVVGNRGSIEINPRDAMAKDAVILGMVLPNMSRRDFRANLFRLSAGLESGMQVIVNREIPLAEASRAHTLIKEGGTPGKIVLTAAD